MRDKDRMKMGPEKFKLMHDIKRVFQQKDDDSEEFVREVEQALKEPFKKPKTEEKPQEKP